MLAWLWQILMRAARRKILLVFVIICMAQLFTHFQLDTYKARRRLVPFSNFARTYNYIITGAEAERDNLFLSPLQIFETSPGSADTKLDYLRLTLGSRWGSFKKVHFCNHGSLLKAENLPRKKKKQLVISKNIKPNKKN